MTFFAVFLFFSFAVAALTMLGARVYRKVPEARSLVAIFWGVGLSWLANLNMWTSWHIPGLRYAWVGVTITGLALSGSALVIHSIVGAVSGLHRKLDDQAEQIESVELRRVA